MQNKRQLPNVVQPVEEEDLKKSKSTCRASCWLAKMKSRRRKRSTLIQNKIRTLLLSLSKIRWKSLSQTLLVTECSALQANALTLKTLPRPEIWMIHWPLAEHWAKEFLRGKPIKICPTGVIAQNEMLLSLIQVIHRVLNNLLDQVIVQLFLDLNRHVMQKKLLDTSITISLPVTKKDKKWLATPSMNKRR